ncbi:unnamed protein product [Albugo candida]|uniref:RWD domain-containing protein n=1 Tax=Albugo candida TaxID=65357 RepID=A0A024FZK5_9STRA|nr:unnamed protein product [Albugo candida]|eukprot:CCI39916.1 unnamed protein product [Albugo candida]
METSDEQLQIDEFDALQSIYANDFDTFVNESTGCGIQSIRSCIIKFPGQFSLALFVEFPPTYPSVEAPIGRIHNSFGLKSEQCSWIIEKLKECFQQSKGQPCIYEWIEYIRETIVLPATDEQILSSDMNKEPERKAVPLKSKMTRPRMSQYTRNLCIEKRIAPYIYHTDTIIDRKSVFQAHIVNVNSTEDVSAFIGVLLSDRKIARATHNILAYRIVSDHTLKDNDSDGEDGAGSKLSHLLQVTNVKNVAVVVSRWYGGIHLGPVRFKHILSIARQGLEAAGFIRTEGSKIGRK